MSASARSRRAVFFDRDGTLNRELATVLARPAELELLPGAARAVAAVRAAGWSAIVLTNQSAIARGWLSPWELEQVHAALRVRLAAEGAELDGLLYCPHLEDGGLPPYRRPCTCRKPAPGLFQRAAELFGLELGDSWIVGDALRDLEAGAEVGVRGALVRTGKGAREAARAAELPPARRPALVAEDVAEAVERILAQEARAGAQGR